MACGDTPWRSGSTNQRGSWTSPARPAGRAVEGRRGARLLSYSGDLRQLWSWNVPGTDDWLRPPGGETRWGPAWARVASSLHRHPALSVAGGTRRPAPKDGPALWPVGVGGAMRKSKLANGGG